MMWRGEEKRGESGNTLHEVYIVSCDREQYASRHKSTHILNRKMLLNRELILDSKKSFIEH